MFYVESFLYQDVEMDHTRPAKIVALFRRIFVFGKYGSQDRSSGQNTEDENGQTSVN